MFQKVINVFILFYFSCSITFGQDLTKDLEQIVKNLDSTVSVSIKVNIDVYSRKGGSKTYSSFASMQHQKNSSLNVLAEQVNFENESYQVSVDNEEKSILIIKKTQKKEEKINKQKLAEDIKKLQKSLFDDEDKVKDTKVVKIVSNSAGVRKYSITKIKDLKEIILVVDMNTNTIKSISYEYTNESEMKGQYILLDYTEFKTGLDLSSQLSTSKYFTESKGTYVLAPAYKTYKLFTEL